MGAQSYTGIFEYEFNDAIVRYFENKFYRVTGICYDVIQTSRNIGLRERVEYANRVMPDFYLEIHHDVAQTEDIEMARQAEKNSQLWKDISGFSVHYSENNPFPERSKTFARLFADEMLRNGLKPNLYHADVEKMMCIDRIKGIYNRINPWGLYDLFTSIPSGFYPLHLASIFLSTAFRIFSCFFVNVTTRETSNPFFPLKKTIGFINLVISRFF